MSPDRFKECLYHLRWTHIDLANTLQCDLSWIEAVEVGELDIPGDIAAWLETLAKCHCDNPAPTSCLIDSNPHQVVALPTSGAAFRGHRAAR